MKSLVCGIVSQKALDVFSARGIPDLIPIEPCVDLLEDERIRRNFEQGACLSGESGPSFMPGPEALPFVRDAKILGFIAKVAANLYRDNQLNLEGIDRRMKRLIDEYVCKASTHALIQWQSPISDFLKRSKRNQVLVPGLRR